MHLPNFKAKVEINDVKIIGGPPTQNLLPLKYKWLYEIFKKANNNFWLPEEISLGNDKLEYMELQPNVKHMYDWLFSMLTTMDLIVTDTLESSIMPYATAPEFRSWLALQGYQEAIHTHSYVTIAEEASLDPDEVFGRYLQEESLYNKIAMAGGYAKLLDVNFTKITMHGFNDKYLSNFILGYSFWALVLEGIWFYLGLSAGTYPALHLRKMKGTADQFQYIRRDEALHYSTGISIIQEIIAEYPDLWTKNLQEQILSMVNEGIQLEIMFANDTFKKVIGLSSADYINQCKFQAEQNLNRLGLSLYPDAKSVLPWLSQSVDLKKEANFFERRVTEYQVGTGLSFDNTSLDDITNWKGR